MSNHSKEIVTFLRAARTTEMLGGGMTVLGHDGPNRMLSIEFNGHVLFVYNDNPDSFRIEVGTNTLISMLQSAGDYSSIRCVGENLRIGYNQCPCTKTLRKEEFLNLKLVLSMGGCIVERLATVARFASTQRRRAILNNVHLFCTSTKDIIAEATDGRMVCQDIIADVKFPAPLDLVIDAKKILAMHQIIKKPDIFHVLKNESKLLIVALRGHTRLIFDVTAEKEQSYPAVDKAFPTGEHQKTIVRRDHVQHQMKLVASLADKNDNSRVKLTFNAINYANVLCEQGEVKHHGSLHFISGFVGPLNISFSAAYALKIMSAYKTEIVEVEFYGTNDPILFYFNVKNQGMKRVLLMPLRSNV